MRRPLLAAALIAAWSLASSARAAPGDLNRCVGPDGRSIFTDKSCESLGASVRPVQPKDAGASGPVLRVHVHDCARTLEELRDGLHAALAAHDVNKTTGFYHWPGTSSAGADEILKRFQTIVARPFVAVEMEHSHEVHEVDGVATEGGGALVIVQSRSPSDPTSMRTEFGLTRYMGCWWVHF